MFKTYALIFMSFLKVNCVATGQTAFCGCAVSAAHFLLFEVDSMEFSKRLKELRKERNLSQMKLSLATKISQSSISNWELEVTEPTASALIALSQYFGESVDYLLGLKD